jgi:RNA polymerase subunit RPABC4/transcription elongation factor Spt4
VQDMDCLNCNREMNNNDTFCGGCGSKLVIPLATEPNSCAVCENKMSPDKSRCQKCGSSDNMYTNEEPLEISAVSSKFSKVLSNIFIVIGLAIMIFAFLNYQSTGDSLRTDNNPAIGLQHVLMIPLGIVGLIVVIAGLFRLRETSEES